MQLPVPFSRRPWRALVLATLLAVAMASAGCSRNGGLGAIEFETPETLIAYEVALEGSPSEEVTRLAIESLSSFRLQEGGAPSLALLRRRAESDVPVLLKILRSQGYYSATAEAAVTEAAVTEAAVTEARRGQAKVTISAESDPPYRLSRHRLTVAHQGDVAPPALDAAGFGSPVGRRADAAGIAAAEALAVAKLRRSGFPYARFTSRSGIADPAAATLEVESRIDAGRAFTFGQVRFEGAKSVSEHYLLTYLPWRAGERFDVDLAREYQRRLVGTNLFTAASVRWPEEQPSGGAGPAALAVTASLEERPPHSISGGLRYDTDLGPSVRVSFEHRNLFGANESLLAEAEVGLEEQLVGVGIRKPQFLHPGQDLLTDLTFKRETLEAFDALTGTFFGGIERELKETLTVGLGGLVELSRIRQEGEEDTAFLLGAPLFAAHDGSNDLLDPTKGYRLRVEATPFVGAFDAGDTEFLVLDATGSGYWKLDDEARYVLAARGRIGSIVAPDLESVPATRRLYSGGGGSVRGYAQDFVGPLDDSDPLGGRSALEAGIELRARLFGDVGGAIFTEAGSVSKAMYPDFEEGVQTAAGFGARYHSPAGPIRLDIAFPLNPRRQDDAFQVYFSIGQAF